MGTDASKGQKVVIVGGGMAGLFSASALLEEGVQDITIIEKSSTIGGLLQSQRYEDPIGDGVDYDFDLGTHFILMTGNPEIDSILKQDLNLEKYDEFSGSLPEGQYLNGQLYTDSGCANATLFSDETLAAIRAELEASFTKDPPESLDSLFDLYTHKYGSTATREILEPALRKFTGQALQDTDKVLETGFNSGRLVIASREEAVALKKNPNWDNVVAFSNHLDGSSDINKFYPKAGGVEEWMIAMEARLLQAGVKIQKSSQVRAIKQEAGTVSSVEVDTAGELACDLLIWTLPPVLLAKLAQIDVPMAPPKMRSVSVINLIVDQKPIEGPYWVVVYDPTITSYRLTLYDNFCSERRGDGYRITVEVLHGGEFEGTPEQQQKIFDEQVKMGIVPPDTTLLWSTHEFIPAGFPVLRPGDADIYQKQLDTVHQELQNVHAVSRYRGGGHGQIIIMRNIHEAIPHLVQGAE